MLAVLLALVLSAVVVLSRYIPDPAAQGEVYSPVKVVDEEMQESIESKFGKVNQEAALEPKLGLFSRIRARRQAVACQQPPQRVAGYCTPTVSQCAPQYAYSAPHIPQAYVNPQYVNVSQACNSGLNAVVTTPSGSRVVAPIVVEPKRADPPSPVQCKDGSCSIINGLKIIKSK